MKPTEQTLLEQMRVNEMEIGRRKVMLDFRKEDVDRLKVAKDAILQRVDNIVAEFYESQTSIDEIALLIGDADTLRRLKIAQRKYILDLFSGFYDMEYVNNRLRIGLVHKRIGVEPTFYLSAVNRLKEILNKEIRASSSSVEIADQTISALDRLIYFDITLVFDTYIRSLLLELEVSHQKVENYAHSLEAQVVERTRQLEELSRLDGMTELYNVRAFHEYLRRDLLSAERNQQPISLVYLDVDSFKEINDTLGHQVGDEILRGVGAILKETCREVDVPCRYGGDEFCLILSGAGLSEARAIAERIIAQFEEHHEGITLSIGIAQTGPQNFTDGDTLIKQADQKMYEAKQEHGSHIAL